MAEIFGNTTATPIKPDLFRNEVDNAFDSKSENAQSGKAVADALNTKMDTFGDVIVKDLNDGTFNITLNLSNENTPIVRDLIIEGVYEKLKMNGVTFIDIMNAGVQTGQISSGSTIAAEMGMFSDKPTTDKSAENMLTNKGYVDGIVNIVKSALNFKGTAKGKGSISLGDVSPMTHKIKIQTKEIEYTTQKVLLSAPEAYKDGYEGTTLEIPEFNKGGYITISSANNPGTTYSFFVNDSEKGITLYSRSVSVNDIGDRFYWAIEITEELSNVSLFFPNNVYDILNDFCVIYNQNQIVTDYIYYEEQENATITEIKDFKATDIIISTDTEVKTVTFTEPDTKEVAIMSTNGAVAITADNTDTNIVVEYNRDIIKAITALENAVGLVNTTLASVVDVEE